MYSPIHQTFGGLYLPPDQNKTVRWGRAVHVGPGVHDYFGNLIIPDIKVGDVAYVMSHGQHDVKSYYAGGEYQNMVLASELDVLTLVDPETFELSPLGAGVEIEILTPPETVDGLYVPDVTQLLPSLARIKTLGKGLKTVEGKRVPFQVEVGDVITYNPLRLMVVDLNLLGKDEKRYIIGHGDILSVVTVKEEDEDK